MSTAADVNTPLHLAVQSGDISIVKLLLSEGVDINAQNSNGDLPLHVAVRLKLLPITEVLLKKGANVNALTRDKIYTSLHIAAKCRNTAMVELLLDREADVNVRNSNGCTPLHFAISSGSESIILINLLLNKGANILAQNKYGYTPLHIATRYQKRGIIKLLLDKGADVNKESITDGTPLHVAARYGIRYATELLLSKKSDVNALLRNGDTPLIVALRFRKTSIVKLLLNRYADVNKLTRNNDTPLHVALRYKMWSIIELMLNRGADVNAQNKNGETPLHLAVRLGKTSVVELLLNKNPNINIQSKTGDTTLHVAVRLGRMHVTKLMLTKSLDVNKLNKNGNTPLHVAVRCRSPSMVELLLDKDVDLNARTKDGDTPLHLAVRLRDMSNLDFLLFRRTYGNKSTKKTNKYLQNAVRGRMNCFSIVELLLNKLSNVNVCNRYGRTPLHLAAVTSDISIVKLLLSKNADMHALAKNGEMPLHIALCYGHVSIAKLLINKGADLNALDSNGHTPLNAAIFEQCMSIAKLLIKRGADVNKQINEGDSPLHLALNLGMTPIVILLLNKGAKINVRRADGSTPLHIAADINVRFIFWSRNPQYNQKIINNISTFWKEKDKYLYKTGLLKKTLLLELLLSKGADINTKNIQGNTPLHLAARNKTLNYKLVDKNEIMLEHVIRCDQRSAVELFLRRGSKVNEKNANEDTPLHEAVRTGDKTIVELLLNNGADVNAQNINGDTPLHEALRFEHDLVSLLLRYGADVTLKSNTGETPFSYALLYSLSDNKHIISVLQDAEKKKDNNSLNTYQSQNPKPRDIFESYGEDMSNMHLKNKMQIKYLKSNDNCGLPGQLYETKLLSLFFMRVLNHQQIEHDIFLGANVPGIGAMDDICLRYCVRGQRPVVMFMQAKHKEDTSEKVTDKDLWNDSGNFSLRKYFNSYLMIKERFKISNKDSMFEGEFNDIDCYFILYTSGKENVTKKTLNKVNEVLHKLINTKQSAKPFQYKYDDSDVSRLAEAVEKTQTNSEECVKGQVKEFFNRLWFYSSQATEDEVENKLIIEINNNYNNDKQKNNNYMFQFHTNAILVRAHDEIHKWWKQTDERSVYLNRKDDFFKLAKVACLDDLLLTGFNAMHHLKVSVDLGLKQSITEHNFSTEAPDMFNIILSRLPRIIHTKNILISLDNDLKNNIASLLLTDELMAGQNSLQDNNAVQDLSMFGKINCRSAISNNNLHENYQFKYSRRSGTSEDGGVLFRTKMLCLVLLRVLNYEQDFLLGSKISGIRVMNDICLRYLDKGHQRPVVLFIQLVHRDDPENRKLIDRALWSESEDFNLLKYFKSYLAIRERFQVDNKNPMFEGEFNDADCYFIVYTSAKENITKKKVDNRAMKVIKNLLNTKKTSEPFQYDYDETDVDRLTKIMVMDQIEDLGTVFLQTIMPGKYIPYLMSDKLIERYHLALARQVLQLCEVQPENEQYRVWKFRTEFFDSDLDYLVILKKAFVKVLLSKRRGQININEELQQNVLSEDHRKKLESLNRIKLPLAFGNLDMTFRGNKAKVEKRVKFVAETIMYLLNIHKDTQIVNINDEIVGPGKTIEQGIIDINGGIGGAVGNLLVLDENMNMLKFDIQNEALPPNASLFLKELKDDRYETFYKNLSSYRFSICISGFPKYHFHPDEFDKKQTRDFLNKFWFSPGQAKEDKVERILKEEITEKYSDNKFYRTVSDLISLQSHDVIQKWWLQTAESPYLCRASELFECIELVQMYNLLQTVINFMYIGGIESIDIKVKTAQKNEKFEHMKQVFKNLSGKLFNLLDPKFNEPFDFKTPVTEHENFVKSKLSLKIHPKMEWVSLTMATDFGNVNYNVVAKVNLRSEDSLAKDGFMLNEMYTRGKYTSSRDCFKDTTMHVSTVQVE